MGSLLDRYVRKLGRFSVAQRVWNSVRYPGIQLAQGVSCNIEGDFEYGDGCSIGEGANITVRTDSALFLGAGCYIGRYVEIAPGGRISISTDASVQDRGIILGDVTIGRHSMIGPNVILSSGHHNYDLDPTALIRDQDRRVSADASLAAQRRKPVVIEEDCWIGINAVVMRGVTVGKGAIVGAGAFVAVDVPPYTVVSGPAARQVQKRLSFIPPKRIDCENPGDLPYFYSGFEVSEAAMKRYAVHGGIAARQDFVLCLDTSSTGPLHIVAKCIDLPGCQLIVGSQRESVAAEFREIVFEQGLERGTHVRIPLRVAPATATLIVKEAWVG